MAKGGRRPGAGRPIGDATIKAQKAREMLMEALIENWSPIVLKAIDQAINGDATARAWLSDRGLGKVVDQLDLSNKDGSLKTIIVQRG